MTTVQIPLEWAKSMKRLLEEFAKVAKGNPFLGFNEFYIEHHAKVLDECIEKALSDQPRSLTMTYPEPKTPAETRGMFHTGVDEEKDEWGSI